MPKKKAVPPFSIASYIHLSAQLKMNLPDLLRSFQACHLHSENSLHGVGVKKDGVLCTLKISSRKKAAILGRFAHRHHFGPAFTD